MRRLGALLFVSVVAGYGCVSAPEPLPPASPTYDHFVFLQCNTLVLATVKPRRIDLQPVYTHRYLDTAWHPLTVARGKLYGLRSRDLLEMDLASGTCRAVATDLGPYVYRAGRLYFAGARPNGRRLVACDLAHGTWRDLMPCPFGPATPHAGIALSPDGKHLAFTEYIRREEAARPSHGRARPADWGPNYQVVVVDLEKGTVARPGPAFHYMRLESESPLLDGPPIVWHDATTVLLVRADVPLKTGSRGPDRAPGLAALDVTTGKVRDVTLLPEAWCEEPAYFGARPHDGRARVILPEARLTGGEYLVDVEAGGLVEDQSIGGGFEVRGIGESRRLVLKGRRIERSERVSLARVAPDGQRVIWSTSRPEGWEHHGLQYYDGAEGAVRKVTGGQIAGEPLWAASADLTPTETVEPRDGWALFTTRPWPPARVKAAEADTRPDVSSALAITLSTDKTRYRRHEPVKLTIAVTNTTKENLTFKRPPHYSLNLGMSFPKGSAALEGFPWFRDLFRTDPVRIGAGESLRSTHSLEPYEKGEHRVSASFRQALGTWRGRLKAEPVRFLIEESSDSTRLLKAKFDRLIALCRREFRADPATCGGSRILRLGPGAAKYLIAEFEATDDRKFREVMGPTLAQMAGPDSLPYYQRLLRSKMNSDRALALDGLAELYRRGSDAAKLELPPGELSRAREAQDEALRVLLAALNHSDPTVRGGAARRLYGIRTDGVARAFEAAVRDRDAGTAAVAARYLAAREGLDLAAWLNRAAEKPTYARTVAARSIVDELERILHLTKGRLPTGSPQDVRESPQKLAAFREVLHGWAAWARENRRASLRFFRNDMQGAVNRIDLPTSIVRESGTPSTDGARPTDETKSDEAKAKEVEQLRAGIKATEAQCVPAKGTLRREVERQFGKGRPTHAGKIAPKHAKPESRFYVYDFCENGTLFVCYDAKTRSRVVLAHYLDPYYIKGRPAGYKPTPDEQLRELRPRLKQMQHILAEHKKRFVKRPKAPSHIPGKTVAGLQASITPSKTSYPSDELPEFTLSLQNTGEENLILNLGLLLGRKNEKQTPYTTTIRLLLTDASGKKTELHAKGPAGFWGPVQDYTASVKSGDAFDLKLRLKDFWCPATKEYHYRPPVGLYRITALYERKPRAGAQPIPYPWILWTGKLTSDTAMFSVREKKEQTVLPGPLTLERRKELLAAALKSKPADLAKLNPALRDVGHVRATYGDGKTLRTVALNRVQAGAPPGEWIRALATPLRSGRRFLHCDLAMAPNTELRRNRDKLLARADVKIRKGLIQLARTFPALGRTGRGALQKAVAGRSPAGRIGLLVDHWPGRKGSTGPGKKVPEAERYYLLVHVRPVQWAESEGQLAVRTMCPYLALEGLVFVRAWDPKLRAALSKLVDDALAPLRRLEKVAAGGPATRKELRALFEALKEETPSPPKRSGAN